MDFSGAAVKPFQVGTILPAACSVGQAFFKQDAAPGQNLYACTALNVWTLEAALPAADGNGGKVLGVGASGPAWSGLAGDVNGPPALVVVQGLQGRSLAPVAPSNGQALLWNATTNRWEPGGASPNYSQPFTSQASVTIPGAAHGYQTANLFVNCYDLLENRVEPNSVSIDDSSRDISVTFSMPQSGRCVVNGGGAGGNPGQLPLGSGDGQVLTWLGGGAHWSTISTGGGASGLQVAWTSPTVLTVGAGCSPDFPCNVRLGASVHSIQAPATATLTGGTGVAVIYVDQNGLLTVGNNLSVTCSARCQSVPGITAFPMNVVPLAIWTATGGAWNPTGVDWRSSLSTDLVMPGVGIILANAGASTTVAVDPAIVPTYLSGYTTLDFPSIPSGACAAEMVIPLTGATPGDTIAAGWPAALEAGLIGTMRTSAADVISVRLCNFSGGPIDPAPAVFTATVIRSF